MKHDITEKQQEILDYIIDYVKKNGYPPTKPDIAKHLGKNATLIVLQLNALEKKGYIKLSPNVARGIQVINKPAGIPFYGSVAAGEGLTASETMKGYWNPEQLLEGAPKSAFAFTVRGDSMEEASILADDIIIVNPELKPKHGCIGVVSINDEITLKYVFYNKDSITLKSANKKFKDRTIKNDDITIIGSVIASYRKF